ncbi:MBL fold metallo-hydrolase [Paenibacillus sp. IB182496]|uniref:MBL fold metallo-hydrolase n=1 Tax=Paenibacillus sabuli TaxID=2772509 RepID=A0A927GQ05_9BACL|nr:MBL fold metallo-hydrolase [Paenibacillus sabuli]MBD2844019.1 MBL fold metallo-hydrolase [Paenibacillus sabuli]
MPKRRYVNTDGSSNIKSFAELRQWQKERRTKNKDLSYKVPRVEPDTARLAANRERATLTFVGHSTFLVQLGGLNIVTDPVWANWMGFSRRLSAPGLPIEALPPIDVVLLSHAHYDHLHLASLRRLPGDYVALVPEGLGDWMRRKGFRRVEELSWWEEHRIGAVAFAFVPARHWTRRTPWDTNTSHWGGWVLRASPQGAPGEASGDAGHADSAAAAAASNAAAADTLYFAGDSGYDERLFREIGERYTGIGVALLPIGAYEPEWFMKDSHMTPEEAVRAFADLGAAHFVPMHYDAYRLADDTAREALDRLQAAWRQRGLQPERLWTMALGETKLWDGEDTAAAARP